VTCQPFPYDALVTFDEPWLSDEQQVWRTWLALSAQLPAFLHRELQADGGLSLPDFDVLVHLTDAQNNRVRVSDLARDLAWERSRLSHHISRMEQRELVRREECLEDGRGAFVALTKKGRAATEKAAPNHVRAVRRVVFDDLDEQRIAALGQSLEVILAALERASADNRTSQEPSRKSFAS